MADELELDLDLGDDQNINNRANERIRTLSSKVEEKANEAAKAQEAAQAAETARLEAEKERDFYASFSDQTSKFPDAAEFKDAIKEKVMAGYSVDDATVAVLAANNKYTAPAQQENQVEVAPAAGGSAATELPQYADKQLTEMTREEKRQALIDADQSGELRKVLKY